jgi:hypothetical protein
MSSDWQPTDEVDDEAAVARAAGGPAEECSPIRRRAVGAGVPRRQADVVAGVCQRVTEAEDARVAAQCRRAAARKEKQERPPHSQCQRGGGIVPLRQQPHVLTPPS